MARLPRSADWLANLGALTTILLVTTASQLLLPFGDSLITRIYGPIKNLLETETHQTHWADWSTEFCLKSSEWNIDSRYVMMGEEHQINIKQAGVWGEK